MQAEKALKTLSYEKFFPKMFNYGCLFWKTKPKELRLLPTASILTVKKKHLNDILINFSGTQIERNRMEQKINEILNNKCPSNPKKIKIKIYLM